MTSIATFNNSSSCSSSVASELEPRKEARLLHYCPICNKGFKDRYSVNVHVRTHTGEKPFSCALCGKCFRQKAHLAKHHQTHAAKQSTILPNTTSSSKDQQYSPSASPTMKSSVTSSPSSSLTRLSVDGKIVLPMSPVSVDIMDQS